MPKRCAQCLESNTVDGRVLAMHDPHCVHEFGDEAYYLNYVLDKNKKHVRTDHRVHKICKKCGHTEDTLIKHEHNGGLIL